MNQVDYDPEKFDVDEYGNLIPKIKLTPYLATAIAEGFCEGEDATEAEQIEAWQYLIDTGLCWRLQGWFGRRATALIEAGICHRKEGD